MATIVTVTRFEYLRRKAAAEAKKAKAQDVVYHAVLELGFYERAAERIAEDGTPLRASSELTQEEADSLNVLLAAVRRATEEIYKIEQNTRIG